MKAKLLKLCLNMILILSCVLVKAQDFSLIVKVGVAPAIKSLDWKNLSINDGSSLGSANLQVPLTSNKPDGTPGALGVELTRWYGEKFSVLFEADLATRTGTIGGLFLVGANYSVLGEMGSQFMLGVTGKFGLAYYSFDAGNATITGTPPYDNGSSTISTGDPLKATITPLIYQLGVTARVKLNDTLYINIQPAFGGSFSNAEVVVKADGEPVNTIAGTGQYVKLGNLSLMAGIEFMF